MKPRKFAFHDSVPSVPPKCELSALLEKADTDEQLSRNEKDRIAENLYGTFSQHSHCYKLLGWSWSANECKQIRRILVSFDHEEKSFRAYYAPDKTSLRKVLTGIAEMIYADDKEED